MVSGFNRTSETSVASGFSRTSETSVASGFSRTSETSVASGFSRTSETSVASGFNRTQRYDETGNTDRRDRRRARRAPVLGVQAGAGAGRFRGRWRAARCEVTVEEEARTRVRDRYVVSAPLPGRMRRIELEPGDPVVAGKTVLALFQPTDPALLDVRTRAELAARVKAADAALGGARAERRAHQVGPRVRAVRAEARQGRWSRSG